MPNIKSEHHVHVKFVCRSGHEHDLCYRVDRGVHPDMRCAGEQPSGYSSGGGGCVLPPDMAARVDWELAHNFQESRRRGYVLIRV